MKVFQILRSDATRYIVLLSMFCLVAAYQLRISLDTVHFERTLDFYIPFLLGPFTNRIESPNRFLSWEQGDPIDTDHNFALRSGDEVLSVNGRAFRGMSLYLRELLEAQRQPPPAPPNSEWRPFVVTIRSSDARIHSVEIGFPHCTCGIPTLFHAVSIWIVPQMFCVLLGFATVCLQPKAALAWAFLGLVLSLSQLQLWSEWYTGFQETATPMNWADWSRVPAVAYRAFVQHAWPAALLAAFAHFHQSRSAVYRLAVGVSAAFAVFAALEAMLQVAWSEDFRKLVLLHEFLEPRRTEFMMVSLAAVAMVAWRVHRRLGAAITAVGLLAVGALYWSPLPVLRGQWYDYSDHTRRYVVTLPAIHNTPGAVALLSTVFCVLAVLVLVRREVTRREAASLILCAPFAVDVAGTLAQYWYLLGPRPFEYWPWITLVSAGIGLLGIAWCVIQRAQPTSASPPAAIPLDTANY